MEPLNRFRKGFQSWQCGRVNTDFIEKYCGVKYLTRLDRWRDVANSDAKHMRIHVGLFPVESTEA